MINSTSTSTLWYTLIVKPIYLFIDNWTQNVVRIHVSELLNGDYYIGEYDTVFVNKKMIEFYKRMIQCHEKRIKESLKNNSYGNI